MKFFSSIQSKSRSSASSIPGWEGNLWILWRLINSSPKWLSFTFKVFFPSSLSGRYDLFWLSPFIKPKKVSKEKLHPKRASTYSKWNYQVTPPIHYSKTISGSLFVCLFVCLCINFCKQKHTHRTKKNRHRIRWSHSHSYYLLLSIIIITENFVINIIIKSGMNRYTRTRKTLSGRHKAAYVIGNTRCAWKKKKNQFSGNILTQHKKICRFYMSHVWRESYNDLFKMWVPGAHILKKSPKMI